MFHLKHSFLNVIFFNSLAKKYTSIIDTTGQKVGVLCFWNKSLILTKAAFICIYFITIKTIKNIFIPVMM